MSSTIEKEIEKIRAETASRRGQHRAIAEALDVHYNWVRRFASGALVEPGAVKYAHLKDWLTRHKRP